MFESILAEVKFLGGGGGGFVYVFQYIYCHNQAFGDKDRLKKLLIYTRGHISLTNLDAIDSSVLQAVEAFALIGCTATVVCLYSVVERINRCL